MTAQEQNAKGRRGNSCWCAKTDKCRCRRLGKYCEPSKAVRKRKIIDRSSSIKVARLEEKLDGLLTLLQPSSSFASRGLDSVAAMVNQGQPTPESMESPRTTPKTGEEPENSPNPSNRELVTMPGSENGNRSSVLSDYPQIPYTATGTKSTLYHSPVSTGLEPSEEEAEISLSLYRNSMMQSFPITLIPESMSARQLQQERPFLWLCIMAITSKYYEQQRALNREMRLTLSRESLLEGKHNLDLLLGLITHVAW